MATLSSAVCFIRRIKTSSTWHKATPQGGPLFRGQATWLYRAFETDTESPYHGLRRDTRAFYSRDLKHLVDKAGDEHLRDITGRDLRRWYGEWDRAHGKRSAYACIQTLRRAVAYGCALRNTLCYDMAQMLEHMAFKSLEARKVRPTYEQVTALRVAAHEAGRASPWPSSCNSSSGSARRT